MQAKYITGIKYGRKASKHTAPRKYGIYRQAEGPLSYIAGVENNAPSMSEKLWKIREQLTIAEKHIFDAIIELPPMEKREAVRKVSEYTDRCKEVVRSHFWSIRQTIDRMDEFNNIKESNNG